MRSIEQIKRSLPYIRTVIGDTFASEITIGKCKGSVVFSNNEGGYEHVSFAPYSGKIPKWDDMCELKELFWDCEEEVYQIMPKKSQYVNIKDNCLHLWRPCNGKTLEDLIKI